MLIPPDIQELVDSPVERLHVEHKRWFDLNDVLARAKIARHLCALANHGSGYLIFGINNDGTYDTNAPDDLSSFTQDHFSGIVDRFLTPTIQCEVFQVRPSVGGKPCVVVRVPSHWTVPICAKANGPQDKGGKVDGIRRGEHYIRVPGPKSVPIDSPELWGPLIRRCVMNDHGSLLQSFGPMFHAVASAKAGVGAPLKDWHENMRKQLGEKK
jgi:predicted HTH transcriptional regulator